MENYSVKEGLPSADVYNVFQDSKGYIWVSTAGGAARFNGVDFTVYNTEQGLPDNTILKTFEDFQGKIWFVPLSGFPCYFKDDSIYSMPILSNSPSSVTSFYLDSVEKSVWFATSGKVVFQDSKERWNEIRVPEVDNSPIYFMGRTENEEILALGFKKCVYFDKEGKYRITDQKEILELLAAFDLPEDISPWILRELFQINDNSFKVNSNFKTDQHLLIEAIALPDKARLISVVRDPDRNIWISAFNGGVYCLKYQEKKVKAYHYLKGKTVSCVYQDQEENLWFSTIGNGIFLISNKNVINLLSGEKITSLFGDGNKLWLGLSNGRIFKMEGEKVDTLDVNKTIGYKKRVLDFCRHSSGDVLFCTDESVGKIDRYNQMFKMEGFPEGNLAVKRIAVSGDSLIVGTHLDLFLFNRSGLKSLAREIGIYPVRISAINIHEKTIWIGSDRGLYRIRGNTILNFSNRFPSLSSKINDIVYLRSEVICFCSNRDGVFLLEDSLLINLTKREGLVGNNCNSLFRENDTTLWVSSNGGVSKISFSYSKKTQVIRNYSNYDGLSSNEIVGVYKINDTIWVATSEGISLFKEEMVNKREPYPIPVYIIDVRINNLKYKLSGQYSLSHRENNIQVSFVGLGYRNGGKTKYRYKLSGIDAAWVSTANASVSYPSLPPGEYLFSVYAESLDGSLSASPALLKFKIIPPFWRTPLFIIPSVFFVVGFLIVIILKRYNSEKKKLEARVLLDKRIADSELKALRAQMNPHFTFNSINSIYHFLLKNNTDSAQQYLIKFSRLMRLVLEQAKLDFITLEEEIEMIELYLQLEALRFNGRFEYEITVDSLLHRGKDRLPSLLLQPFVENAIWHGLMNKEKGKGRIQITFTLIGVSTLLCRILDNGIGRKKAMEIKSRKTEAHKSFGMQIAQERIDLLKSITGKELCLDVVDLKDGDNNAIGTLIEFRIPLER